MAVVVKESERKVRRTDTAERLERIREVIGTSKQRGPGLLSGHCMLVAEIKAGLVNYHDLDGRGPNDPRSVQALIDKCGGVSWKYPRVTEGSKSEEVIRCNAPWHSGDEEPTPREELLTARPTTGTGPKRAATDTHCKNGHEWTEDNTYVDPRGSKVCRECKREAALRHKAKKEGSA